MCLWNLMQKKLCSCLAAHIAAKSIATQGRDAIKINLQPQVFMYSMRSARSFSFLIPANTIFVPGIYFFGLTKYSNMCFSDQTMPEFLLASEYAKPSDVPDVRPNTPQS